MTITKTNALTDGQKQEIQALENAAYKKYKLQNHAYLTNEINFDRKIPCFFLGHVGERLVAFLTTFLPTRQEGEIVAFTHPDFQRKGCFSQLLAEASRILILHRIRDVVFAVEPASKNGLAVLKTFGNVGCGRSEYRMSVSSLKNAPPYGDLQFFEVDISNQELFRTALAVVYPDNNDRDNFFDAVLHSDLRRGYIAYKDRPIGVFNIGMEQGDAFIYGVGVAKEFRGVGYGKELMGYAMHEGLRLAKKLVLDVDSDNPVAIHIYKKCGFKIDFQVNYYKYKI